MTSHPHFHASFIHVTPERNMDRSSVSSRKSYDHFGQGFHDCFSKVIFKIFRLWTDWKLDFCHVLEPTDLCVLLNNSTRQPDRLMNQETWRILCIVKSHEGSPRKFLMAFASSIGFHETGINCKYSVTSFCENMQTRARKIWRLEKRLVHCLCTFSKARMGFRRWYPFW